MSRASASIGGWGGPRPRWRAAAWRRGALAAAVAAAAVAGAVAGVGLVVAYDIARNAAGVLMRRGSILTHDCKTGAGPCPSGLRCFRQYFIDFDCDTGELDPAGWQAGPIQCLPEGTSTGLTSEVGPNGDYPCRLSRYVASGTCCPSDCSGAVTTTPPLPTIDEATSCCCCPCPDDCTGCGTDRTVTISGSGGPWGAGGIDGTFPLKSELPRAAGDPPTSTLAACQWFWLHDDGSITNDITLACTFTFLTSTGKTIAGWGVSTPRGIYIRKSCCPPGSCPPSGVYKNPDVPGIIVSVS